MVDQMLVSNKINKIKKFNNIVIALVGNKNDLEEPSKDEWNNPGKQVSDEEALAFAKEINTIFKIVSAKTGAGVDDLFYTIGEKFLEKLKYLEKEQIQQTINYPKKEHNFDKKLKKYLD